MGASSIRQAARVVLLDNRDRVLLLRFVDRQRGTAFWITPGGGLEDGEGFEAAAQRELAEEVGLSIATPLGGPVWQRDVRIVWGEKHFRQHERFFVHRVQRHTVCDAGRIDYERTELTGHRWWSVQEIAASTERFAPGRLAHHLAQLLAGPGGAGPRTITD